MLYLPIALRGSGRSFDACLQWVTSVFAPLGVRDILMWTDLSGHNASELQAFDALYIGGGNTFSLLAQLRRSGFDRALASFAREGGAIYGGSAGAIIMGRDILTCAHMDRNDVGLTDSRGLDLVSGHAVWCHYHADDDPRIQTFVQVRGIPVLAISERAGVAVLDGRMAPAGFDPVYRFDADGKRALPAADPGGAL